MTPRSIVPGDDENQSTSRSASREIGEPSRREFLQLAGITATGVSGMLLATSEGAAQNQPAVNRTPDAVLARLLEGNQRFVGGQLTHPGRKPEDFVPLAEGQAPLAIIVACSDSRVSPEVMFDQGVGDLFVVRVAGNVVSNAGPTMKGSIEFAVAELGARLIIVLGHTQCGAVKAAIAHIDANDTLPGSIRDLVELIRPAAASVRGKEGDKLENATRANILQGVEVLKNLDPIIAKAVKAGEVKVVGGVYELHTGLVKMLA